MSFKVQCVHFACVPVQTHFLFTLAGTLTIKRVFYSLIEPDIARTSYGFMNKHSGFHYKDSNYSICTYTYITFICN